MGAVDASDSIIYHYGVFRETVKIVIKAVFWIVRYGISKGILFVRLGLTASNALAEVTLRFRMFVSGSELHSLRAGPQG
ncbi:hypothetical protein NPIL_259471, partial [Nephila pilipes]